MLTSRFLPHVARCWRIVWITLCVLSVTSVAASAARAQTQSAASEVNTPDSIISALPSDIETAGVLRQSYRIFFAGFDVGLAEISTQFFPDGRYYIHLSSSSESAGLLRFVAKWNFDSKAWGHFKGDSSPIPDAYRNVFTFRDRQQSVESAYQNSEIVYYRLNPGMPEEYYRDFSDEQQEQLMTRGNLVQPLVSDPINSALQFVYEINKTGGCTLPDRGFFAVEGPLTVGLRFHDSSDLEKNGPSPFTGRALRCVLYGGGDWLDRKEYARRVSAQLSSREASLYFAPVPGSPLPLQAINVTVRTDGGSLRVYLVENEWTPGDQSLVTSAQWNQEVTAMLFDADRCGVARPDAANANEAKQAETPPPVYVGC